MGEVKFIKHPWLSTELNISWTVNIVMDLTWLNVPCKIFRSDKSHHDDITAYSCIFLGGLIHQKVHFTNDSMKSRHGERITWRDVTLKACKDTFANTQTINKSFCFAKLQLAKCIDLLENRHILTPYQIRTLLHVRRTFAFLIPTKFTIFSSTPMLERSGENKHRGINGLKVLVL